MTTTPAASGSVTEDPPQPPKLPPKIPPGDPDPDAPFQRRPMVGGVPLANPNAAAAGGQQQQQQAAASGR